jgi:predicted N-acetyltransferase YhbS
MLVIAPEGPLDGPAIETLLDRCFGPDRRRKTSYRYRDGIGPLSELCFVARTGGRLVGAIRYWPIRLGTRPALLLGPLAIDPDLQGRGIGRALTSTSLARASALGWQLVFLVGDPAYYARHGFAVVPPGIVMPGEDPGRVQYRTLAGASLPAEGGLLLHERCVDGPDVPAQEGQEGLSHQGQALVRGRSGVHGDESLGHGGGGSGAAHRPGQGLQQRANGERDGPGLGQAPQGLPLDPEPQALTGVLGREVWDRLALARME